MENFIPNPHLLNEASTSHPGINIRVVRATRFLDAPEANKTPVYPMRSRNRGVYLVVSNFNDLNNEQLRQGADEDHNDLISLFNQIGLVGEHYKNLKPEEIESVVKKFIKCQLIPVPDCCIVALIGNGFSDTTIDWLPNYFNGTLSQEFNGIPKILIFDVPRGDQFLRIAPSVLSRAGICKKIMRHTFARPNSTTFLYCDILICWSTICGYSNVRSNNGRSWFIESLCQIWAVHAHDHHVEQLMKLVQEEMRTKITEDGKIQSSEVKNLHFRTCYLHPALYME